MQKTTTPGAASPARNRRRECCTDAPCDSGLRNQYFDGKRLTADSFRVEQSYALERRRLLNHAIHGWGVVYGYALKSAPASGVRAQDQWGRLQVGPGLAFDECGRELLQTAPSLLGVGDAMLLDGKGARIERPPEGSYGPRAVQGRGEDGRPAACWLLSVHYAEQLAGPVRVNDPCNCERNEWEHVCETVRFSLKRVDCAACCADFDCELTCGCGTGPCCDEPGKAAHRGGRQCLCEHLAGLPEAECGGLREIEDPCAHVRADLCHGVALACVRLREGECDGEWLFDGWIDACGPRRLVKRNDLLFDLIRGCDLTRISAIGWAGWHRSRDQVGWEAFEASFGALAKDDLDRMRNSRDRHESFPVVTSDYWVEFSRPVRADTVRADCFTMTVLGDEVEGGWTGSYRVPILDAKTAPPDDGQPGLVTRAALVVDGRWLYDAVKGARTIFDERPVTVEIEIRGDLIVDCNGQAVDANAHGLLPAPSGNGTPGGTFVSSFQVQPRGAGYQLADDSAHRREGVES